MNFSRRIYALNGLYQYINPKWSESLAQSELGGADEWRTVQPADVILDSNTTQVYRVQTPAGAVIFKRYQFPDNAKRYFMRPGRAACEWSGLHALKNAGLPVPDLVAFSEERKFGRLCGAYVITAEIGNSMNLEDYAVKIWYPMTPIKKQKIYQAIKTDLFALVKKAHGNGLYHRDLFWRNILVREEDGVIRLWLIDCPRLIRTNMRARHSEMIDLSCMSRMALSLMNRSERFRALLEFVDNDRQAARRLFREIQAHHLRSKHPPHIFDPASQQPGFVNS